MPTSTPQAPTGPAAGHAGRRQHAAREPPGTDVAASTPHQHRHKDSWPSSSKLDSSSQLPMTPEASSSDILPELPSLASATKSHGPLSPVSASGSDSGRTGMEASVEALQVSSPEPGQLPQSQCAGAAALHAPNRNFAFTIGDIAQAHGFNASPDLLNKLKTGPAIPRPVESMTRVASLDITKAFYNPRRVRNVYIRGLPPKVTDEVLLHMTERFGRVISVKSIVDVKSGWCKGFGFVEFAQLSACEDCIGGLGLLGYQCSYAKEPLNKQIDALQDYDTSNLYISGLPPHYTERDVMAIFEKHQPISTRVLRHHDGRSRGVGFALMSDRNSAQSAVNAVNGRRLDGNYCLGVKFADSQRQKRFKTQTVLRRAVRASEYDICTRELATSGREIPLEPQPAFNIRSKGLNETGLMAPQRDTFIAEPSALYLPIIPNTGQHDPQMHVSFRWPPPFPLAPIALNGEWCAGYPATSWMPPVHPSQIQPSLPNHAPGNQASGFNRRQ